MARPTTDIDPTISSAPESTWRHWWGLLAQFHQDRLAGFGIAVLLGFALGAAALWGFAFIADGVLELETASLDAGAANWVHQFRSPLMDTLAPVITAFGSELVVVVGAVVLVWLGWQRRWGAAGLLILVTGGAQLLNDVLKGMFHRTRPAPLEGLIAVQQYSFPSGHAMVATAFYFYLGYLAWRLTRGWVRWAIVLCLTALVLVIGFTRIYLNAHFLSDVLAGYLAGFVWADAVIIAGLLLRTRHTVRQ